MSDVGRIVQLSVSNGGVPKRAVHHAHVTALGLEGDAHRDREHHGGPERAVCLFALAAIRGQLDEGTPCGGWLVNDVAAYGRGVQPVAAPGALVVVAVGDSPRGDASRG